MKNKNFIISVIIFITVFSLTNISFAQRWTLAGQVQSPGLEPSISVVDGYNVWIAGGVPDTPRVYRTTNGGENWIEVQTAGITKELYCIYAVNPETVFVGEGILSGNAKLFKTTNAGLNWTVSLQTNPNQGYFNSIIFSNSNPLVGAAQAIRIYITTNGGTTWIQRNPGGSSISSAQNALMLIDANFFGFGMNNGAARVTITLNSGTSWLVQNLNIFGNYVCGFDFKEDKLIGLASTSTSIPNIARTSNGGDSWVPIDIGSEISGKSIIKFVPGTNIAYIVGSNGTIKKSSDDGLTWSIFSTATISGINHFNVKNINNVVYGYAVSNDGSIIKFTDSLTILTGIRNIGTENPTEYKLYQNYPNPFNPSTNIKFQIPEEKFIQMKVFNLMGQEVATLVNKRLQRGVYEVNWDASKFPSGVYFYQLTADNIMQSMNKMILIK